MTLFYFSLLTALLLSYTSIAQRDMSHSTLVKNGEKYVVKVNEVAKQIQIGTPSESIIFTFTADTVVSSGRLKNEPLYQQNLPILLSVSAKKKKIRKEDQVFAKQISERFKNKIFRLERLDSNIWLVATRFPQKRRPFERRFMCDIIKKDGDKIDILASDGLDAKHKLHIYKHPWWGSYLILHQKRARKAASSPYRFFVTIHYAIE